MTQLLRDIGVMQRLADDVRRSGKRIGLVPTMGALHAGHLTLIAEARKRSDIVITTVFVNPKQFGPSEDFTRYPRSLERDVAQALGAGADYVFAPDAEMMYLPDHAAYVDVTRLDEVLEGRARPGHFRGVATVVAKLFNITKPHVAVFGQKDAQQAIIIRRMVRDLNMDIDVVVAPIAREADGLAMSSRNVYLTDAQRKEANVLYRSLQLAQQRIQQGRVDSSEIIREMKDMISANSSGQVEYISIADAGTLEEMAFCNGPHSLLVSLAVRFGTTRLIDNITVNGREKQ